MYIVIETFGGADCASIVVDEHTGNNKVFDTKEGAQEEANDWQDAIVISL